MDTMSSLFWFVVITLSLCVLGTSLIMLAFPHVSDGQAIGSGIGVWILMFSARLMSSAEVS